MEYMGMPKPPDPALDAAARRRFGELGNDHWLDWARGIYSTRSAVASVCYGRALGVDADGVRIEIEVVMENGHRDPTPPRHTFTFAELGLEPARYPATRRKPGLLAPLRQRFAAVFGL